MGDDVPADSGQPVKTVYVCHDLPQFELDAEEGDDDIEPVDLEGMLQARDTCAVFLW